MISLEIWSDNLLQSIVKPWRSGVNPCATQFTWTSHISWRGSLSFLAIPTAQYYFGWCSSALSKNNSNPKIIMHKRLKNLSHTLFALSAMKLALFLVFKRSTHVPSRDERANLFVKAIWNTYTNFFFFGLFLMRILNFNILQDLWCKLCLDWIFRCLVSVELCSIFRPLASTLLTCGCVLPIPQSCTQGALFFPTTATISGFEIPENISINQGRPQATILVLLLKLFQGSNGTDFGRQYG